MHCGIHSYLDFVTLKNHWFQHYIAVISVTLQRKPTETAQIWTDIKTEIKATNQIGFDSIEMFENFVFDPDSEYRLKLQI